MSCDECADQQIQGLGVSAGFCHGMAVVLGAEPDTGSENSGPVVLVAQEFSPEEVLSMDVGQVCGFITAGGGITAPSGIVARSSGLPAVVACAGLDQVKSGDMLYLNGDSGLVMINPSAARITSFAEEATQFQERGAKIAVDRHLPAETLDGLKIDILAALDIVDAVPSAITSGAMGIGLLRSEFYYLTDDGAPSEEFLFSVYQHALSSVAPFPTTIRTLDLNGGQLIQGGQHGHGPSSVLGLKGIRFSLRYLELFKTQLRALYRASAFGKLRILLPMIGSLDELSEVKQIMAEVYAELSAAGVDVGDDVEVGLMIEVPAAVFIAYDLACEVDFFAIGMNDLSQYTLAVDRTDATVSPLYDPLHPALLRMISQLVTAGHRAGIHVGVGGEMVGEPMYTPILLGLGVDWLSMPISAIAPVKKMVRQCLADECLVLAGALLSKSSSLKIRACWQEYLSRHNDQHRVQH